MKIILSIGFLSEKDVVQLFVSCARAGFTGKHQHSKLYRALTTHPFPTSNSDLSLKVMKDVYSFYCLTNSHAGTVIDNKKVFLN